jgi:hypothetical protein
MTVKGGVKPSDSKVQKTITVEGRQIAVKMPTAEQLMAWEATISVITNMQLDAVDFPQTRAVVDRFYRIAQGTFVHEADKEWLTEARLDGVVSIEKESVLGMVKAIVDAYADDTGANRSTRRAAARKKA